MLKFFEKYNKSSWLITILIAIFIFYMSSKTFKGVNTGPAINSYIYHFAIFFIFAFFLIMSIIKGKKNNHWFILLAVTIAIMYGISDEIHQFFVPGRYCCLEDALVNSTGILSAGIIYTARLRINGKKNMA